MAADSSEDAPEVLFVCVHNAGRSQMAAALLERKAEGRVTVFSAGSEPADQLHPAVVEAMREIGIDLAGERPKRLEDRMVKEADVVITMGCGDACPIYPGKRYEDWELEDPSGKDLEAVRGIRDEIAARIDSLLAELMRGRSARSDPFQVGATRSMAKPSLTRGPSGDAGRARSLRRSGSRPRPRPPGARCDAR
jgi:arsenate reductase (thioredoxin)